MSISKLPTDYVDEVVSGARKYRMIENQDDTVSFEDESTYTVEGSGYGATDVNLTNSTINELIDLAEGSVSDISTVQTGIQNLISGATTAGSAEQADTAGSATTAGNATTAGSVNNDFILINKQALTFTNNVCTLSDARITADSLADVYFTADSLNNAQKAVIGVETSAGAVTLTAGRTPSGTLTATIRIKTV